MKSLQFFPALLSFLLFGACTTPPPTAEEAAWAEAQFANFKALAGNWVAPEDSDFPPIDGVSIAYKVTAAGHTVEETLVPGSPMEMISMIHLDNGRLMMTHYCAAGNQPRMLAKPGKDGAVEFDFVDITNLASPDALHIHDAVYYFDSATSFRSKWSSWRNGAHNGFVSLVFTRPAAN